MEAVLDFSWANLVRSFVWSKTIQLISAKLTLLSGTGQDIEFIIIEIKVTKKLKNTRRLKKKKRSRSVK